jgi:prepilin-type N-terminal cleavage/methylation domain-containing protein/prepilin-type processing-associated H-X9-DG protein
MVLRFPEAVMRKSNEQKPFVRGAFTLIELLVVIAIIAILAAMLLPALAKAKDQAQQAKCRSDIKELALGMSMYLNEFQDVYPADGSRSTYAFQPMDWIYWRSGTATPVYNGVSETIDKSPVVAYLGTKTSTNLFRCPADINDRDRHAVAENQEGGPIYWYSYSMNGNGLNGANVNLGLTSVMENNGTQWYPFKNTAVRRPASIINFAEEDTLPANPGDAPPPDQDSAMIDDGRWVPQIGPGDGGNWLTTRHDGNANVGLVDGHVQTVNWKFGTNALNTQPLM